MKRIVVFGCLTWMVLIAGEAWASPTGGPLVTYPVQPCRFLDTRVSGNPLPSSTAMDAFVRGSALSGSDGALQSDCRVPATAEAVRVNITVVSPTSNGYLRINGTGSVGGPLGAYSRLTYAAGQNIANEIEVNLCNVYLYPHEHQACPFDGAGRYLDFQILNLGASDSTVHIVGDVAAYLERPKFSAVWGVVESIDVTADGPLSAYIFHLDSGLRLFCPSSWAAKAGCGMVVVGDRISAVALAEQPAVGEMLFRIQGRINIKP